MWGLGKISGQIFFDRIRCLVKPKPCVKYNFYTVDAKAVIKTIGKAKALDALNDMLMIRNFEQRGEQSYQMGKVWGFYHAYIGQEAIQTSATYALGKDKNLWVTTYRCHALALLLGMSVQEGMSELYGKATGNAQGRGGSMHLYADNMYGGFGIVGGQWPIGAGLAFSLKYRGIEDEISICFGGDGSVFQGTFHETANMAKLWNLPALFVIENNQMSMGTQIERGIAKLPVGENVSKAYGIKSYTVDGMDFCACYSVFQEARNYIQTNKEPVILEAVTNRFRGHSISDAATYRTKEELKKIMERDPILLFKELLKEVGFVTEEEFEEMNKRKKEEMIEAMKVADADPYPDIAVLEDGVYIE